MLEKEKKFYLNKTGQKLTSHAKNCLVVAGEIARSFGYEKIESIHLFYAIYNEKGSLGRNLIKDLGIKKDFLESMLKSGSSENKNKEIYPSENFKKIFIKAYSVAKNFGYSYVGTEHLVYSLLNSEDIQIKKVFSQVELQKTARNIKSFFEPNQLSGLSKFLNLPEILSSQKQAKKRKATPFIDKYCLNLNEESKKKKEVIIGRKKEIERMINILGRKNKNNPLLIGDPGVGKTALVSGLSQMIESGNVPPSLYRKKIMNLDVASLIAGTSFRGEFESRLKEILKETAENKNIILFIDEIHNIVGAGNVAGSLDLANILKPALAREEIRLIGATTTKEYKKYIEKDAALERRFQPVSVGEPSISEAKKILFGIRKNYEEFHNVSISDEALNLAVDLSVQYIQNRFLPDKAIDVIDEAASNIRSKNKISDFLREIRKLEDEKLRILEEKEKLVAQEKFEEAINFRTKESEIEGKIKILQEKQNHSEKENPVSIGDTDIIETVSKISGIPEEKLAQTKGKKVKNIQKMLSSLIIGQKEAMEKLSQTILRSQSGITNPERPLGSFLFLGPTGVGKTLTAKVLAKEFFGSDKSLVRIDMSELAERHNVSSLIGSPAGYIGFGEGGNLTEKIRRNPYSVVLFDEIEKAHPDVHNILLQILEDGILTDAEGTQANFRNTIVILTSNIGTDEFTNASEIGFESGKNKKDLGEKFNLIKDHTLKELEKKLKPELLNRLDYVLVFNALGRKEIEKIVEIEMEKLKKRLEKRKINLSFNKSLIKFITEKSLAFNQGARLVRKNIQELVENKIAELIIYEQVEKNKISVSIRNKNIIIK